MEVFVGGGSFILALILCVLSSSLGFDFEDNVCQFCNQEKKMPTLMLLCLLPLLTSLPSTFGIPFDQIHLPSSQSQNQPSVVKKFLLEHVKLISKSASHKRHFRPSLGPQMAPSPSPTSQGPTAARPITYPKHHHRHHRMKPRPITPSPSSIPGCGQVCVEPLTSVPIGTPCGCVLPMKVRLQLDVSLYAVFPMVDELAAEISLGTFLQKSQVSIIGANADTSNQDKTVVDINLVPLDEKFDKTTALLTYLRIVHKKVPLNTSIFGDYEVAFIFYPGLPSSSKPPGVPGSGPIPSIGSKQFPITADVMSKTQKLAPRVIFVIVLSAIVFLVVLCGAIVVLIKYRKAKTPSNSVGPVFTPSMNKRSGIDSMVSSSRASLTSASFSALPASLLSVKTFSLAELEKATDKFSLKRVLGEGGFGRVYHGVLEDMTEVAVKLLMRDNFEDGDREFIAEVEMLSRLHHRNLVKLIGICIEGRTRCLVYEVVHNGSVESHLHGVDKRKKALDWDARLKIALGAARGLAYLHEDSNPRVIHRDFKASNVLLEDDFTPKVSDFGLAREATEGSHHISTRVMGTFGYVAPEYAMTGHLLVKSDVYSYGVVLLELLTGRKPVDMAQPPGQENLVTWARPLFTSREGLEELVDASLAGTYNFDDMAKVAAIASMCVHLEVTQRPFMGEVVQALKLIYNDNDETEEFSQRESSARDSEDYKGDLNASDSSWWNAGALSPHLTYGHASGFITMDYSSGPLDEFENRAHSASSLGGNRSGPLRITRSKSSFARLKGSMSEHGGLVSRHSWV